MIEWSRDNELTYKTADEFIWHQSLLSLLYDEVLVQDEILTCTKKLARWFSTSEQFDFLTKVFEAGGLHLLKRPPNRYPEDYRERVSRQPLNARREYLQSFSIDNSGANLSFNRNQIILHNRLDEFLYNNPRLHRFAGERNPYRVNIMERFTALMIEVLTQSRYKPWLRKKFPHITTAIADQYSLLLTNIDFAIDRLKRTDSQATHILQRTRSPAFNTALAIALASTFPGKAAMELQKLVETVFATPFCQEEQAEGRYGKRLRDLPIASDVTPEGKLPEVYIVNTEIVSLRLPKPTADLPAIINQVKEGQSGQRLRYAMANLGVEPDFKTAVNAWRDVADDLSSSMASSDTMEIALVAMLGNTIRGAILGFFAGLAATPLVSHTSPSILENAISAGLGGVADLSLNLLNRSVPSIRNQLKRDKLQDALREAVQFSCIPHPVIQP
jgi:hypothetical protein